MGLALMPCVGQLGTGRHPKQMVKQVFDLIEEETSFLLGTRDQISALPPEERAALHTSIVLDYIGVRGRDDVDLLVSVFYRGQDTDDLTLKVEADSTLDLLRAFMREKDL